MTGRIDDGGPAFPLLNKAIGYHADIRQAAEGLSMRDYFAAKALQGLLAQFQGVANGCDPAHHAKWSYQMADAMLKERTDTADAALTEAYAEGRKDEREELKPAVEALSFAIRFFDQLTPADAERMRKVLEKVQQ